MADRRTSRSGSGARRARAREARLAYALLLPAILAIVLLILFPLLWNLILSLQQVRLIDLRDFGLLSFLDGDLSFDNFRRVTSRPEFWAVVARTFIYAFLGTVLSIAMGLWAALAMRHAFRGRGLMRALLLVPYVMPVIAATYVWRTMLSPQYGVVNAWGQDLLGWSRIDFLGERSRDVSILGLEVSLPVSFMVVIAFEAWRYFPFAYIFILARRHAVPGELYEAAVMDGATLTQQFRHITFPELRGVLAVLFLIRFIWNFNDFTNVFLLTGGAAGTRVISIEIYEWLIARSNPGAAAALSLVLASVLVMALGLYVRFGIRKEQA